MGCRAGETHLPRRRTATAQFVLLSFCLLVSTAASAESSADAQPQPGDMLVTGSIADASRLLPILASDSASGDIVGLVFNGLLKYNEQLEVTGDLAQSWTVSPDGLTITVRLRPDIRWHDGVAMTADDVVFTYRKLIDPTVKTPFSSDYERIQSVEAVDPRTVRVTYREPFAPALESWMMGIIPKHLLEHEDVNTTPFLRRPIGTGPYRFVRWKTEELIELEANPDYVEHRPYINRYLYRVIPDTATMFLELLTGHLDWMALTPLQYRRQTDGPHVRRAYQKYRYPSFGFTYIGYNLDDPRFADVRVRRAIDLAVDKQAIVDGVLYGLGAVATGPYPEKSWAYNPAIRPTAPDLAAANVLLADAGWTDHDGDGWLDKDGTPLRFTLMTNQGNEVRRQVAEIVQQQLKPIGIDVKIRVIEWATFLHEFIDQRRFDAVLLGWNLSLDPDLYNIFHSSKTKEGEYNFIGYANPTVDRLLEQGRQVFDRDQRRQIYQEIHRLLHEDQPYTFLYVPDSLPIVAARFRNVRATPIGIGYNFIDWYVPRADQRYRRLAP